MENTRQHIKYTKANKIIVDTIVTFHYTTGALSTWQTFGYGYYEAKIRLPDTDDTALYGYRNAAFWGFNRNPTTNADWQELDYCEITNDGGTNKFTCDAHMEQPFGEKDSRDNANLTTDPPADPEHFMNIKTDRSAGHAKYYEHYERNFLHFNGGWHIIGAEWSPNQVKFYLDDKIWFRLEGDYTYNYHDDLHNLDKYSFPIAAMSTPMQIILAFGVTGKNPSSPGAPQVSMDVDYVRYYRLKKNCNLIVTKPGTPATDLCSSYTEQVCNGVILGQPGCTSCNVGPASCRTSVRAKSIIMQDGFKVSAQGSFYACDVDCDKLP